MRHLRFATITVALCLAWMARAEVRLPAIFSYGMVLQRDKPVPIWGWAAPGEKIRVEFAGQLKTTEADAAGHWSVTLASMSAAPAAASLTAGGAIVVTVNNVLVGEVWFLSGQSNMEYALFHCEGGDEAIAHAENPNLRLFTVAHATPESPGRDVAGKWAPASPATVRTFSAVGYWFGAKLQKELGVPVGLVNNSYGGTNIEAWMSRSTLQGIPDADGFTDFAAMKSEYAAREEKARSLQDQYDQAVARARAERKPAPPVPAGLAGVFRGPSMVYNGEVAPLIPLAVRGVAWYQGESNAYVGGLTLTESCCGR